MVLYEDGVFQLKNKSNGGNVYPKTTWDAILDKPDLSSYVKRSDQKASNNGSNYQELSKQSDASLIKQKVLGVKDYTPQTDPSYNQDYHLENPAGFMNDMQSIFQDRQGLWHVYYLYNQMRGINGEGGTSSWQHATSSDGIFWKNDETVAIKADMLDSSVKWGSVATGSVVISDGTIEGTSDGDFVAFFSSYGAKGYGGQSIWAVVSKDNGVSYTPLYTEPVMPNHENLPDFRDPCVIKHNGKWVAYLAENQKIGTYNSTNGKDWHYVGGTMTTGDQFNDGKDYGMIECPYVAEITADDGTKQWVMFFGCNDYQHGYGTGTSYLVGTVDDNGVFTKKSKETLPLRIDIGTDYYGSNFGKIDDSTLITSSWVNNWGYATPEVKGVDGSICYKGTTCALFRDAKLYKNDSVPSGYYFKSRVLPIVNRSFPVNNDWRTFYDIASGNSIDTTINNSRVVDYIVKSDDGTGYFTLNIDQDDNSVSFFVDLSGGVCHMKRSSKGNFDSNDYNFESKSISYYQPGLHELNLTVYYDTKTIEFEIANNGQVFTVLKWGKRTNPSTKVQMKADGRTLTVNNKVYPYK